MKVNFFLRDSKAKRITSIGAYFEIDSKRYYLPTGLRIPPEKWNTKDQRAKTGRTFTAGAPINNRLTEIEQSIMDAYLIALADQIPMNREYFKLAVSTPAKDSTNFFQTAKDFMADLEANNRFGYMKSFSPQVEKLKKYLKKHSPHFAEKLPLEQITVKMLKGYIQYIQTQIGNGPNTVQTSIKRLSHIYQQAVNDLENRDLRTKLVSNNPFERIGKIKSQKSEKVRLTIDEIKKLEELELKVGSLEWHALNVWLFSYYTAGIRAGDVLLLRHDNFDLRNNRYFYLIGKTKAVKATKHSLPLIPQARRILELYLDENTDLVFPFIKEAPTGPKDQHDKIAKASALWRKYLKKVAEIAEVRHFSPHTARHSFSQRARQAQVATSDIKMALAHSSVRTTEKYLNEFDTEAADRSVLKTFGYA